MQIQFFIRYTTTFGQRILFQKKSINDSFYHENLSMEYVNTDWWRIQIEIPKLELIDFLYSYQVIDEYNNIVDAEIDCERTLPADCTARIFKVYDAWMPAGAVNQVYETGMFQRAFHQHITRKNASHEMHYHTHLFKVKAYTGNKDYAIALLGNCDALGNWQKEKYILLHQIDGYWQISIDLKNETTPFAYKYVVVNTITDELVQYENGDNRMCFESTQHHEMTILNDGYARFELNHFKGSGVAIPVFSLRSKKSGGIGEFTDIKLLVDWCAKVGLKLIQLLPINDTIASFTNADSYPYAAISAFALHPIYIHLDAVVDDEQLKSFKRKKEKLNRFSSVDYEKVLDLKLTTLREYFESNYNDLIDDEDFQNFYTKNEHWLKPYAAFSYLRDSYGTVDYTKWKKNHQYKKTAINRLFQASSAVLIKVQFYCFLQFTAHQQFSEVVLYAHKKGIALKGDLPIGVAKYSCDTWVQPSLYNMNMQAGAPPDDFAVEGQNWGFPTYNWDVMAQDNYAWWRNRLSQMNQYFDVLRIDHVLGFFRIWSIPQTATQGILGKFVPAIPISRTQFGEHSIAFDEQRFCTPFITDEVLYQLFGAAKDDVVNIFMQPEKLLNLYVLKEEFNTQQKIEYYCKTIETNEYNKHLKKGLLLLLSNIILLKDDKEEAFHFRINMHQTLSYRFLDQDNQQKIWQLYVDYFYNSQEDLWRKEGMKKLPMFKKFSDMLICGEDLGMVPNCVPSVMQQLGLLSLEVQRMPKSDSVQFVDLDTVPYLSVVTPATHDMSTIRGWWQEDYGNTQKFYHQVLKMSDEVPGFCASWIVRAIILQHLYAPAMWSIFQIQDILSMSDTLCAADPDAERINIPANPHHYWGYRMHLNLEDLIKENEFNQELKEYISNSGR